MDVDKNPSNGANSTTSSLLVIIVALAFGGWYIWYSQRPVLPKTPPVNQQSSASAKQASATNDAATPAATPDQFVDTLLATLDSGVESNLEAELTPAYKSFRRAELAKPDCKSNIPNSSRVLALICSSLLTEPLSLQAKDTVVADYTFKSGQKGKSVMIKVPQSTADKPGNTYYIFSLLPSGKGWLLHDYADLYTGEDYKGTVSPIGLREVAR